MNHSEATNLEIAFEKTKLEFSKVSEDQFIKDMINTFHIQENEENIHIMSEMYKNIKLPKRATKGSGGYDFYAPFAFKLMKGQNIVIPTGIRCLMDIDEVLMLFPRSGHGFKYRLSICNTVGIIDSDYVNSKNEGHIMIKIVNDGIDNNCAFDFSKNLSDEYQIDVVSALDTSKDFCIHTGDAFAQGIITKYLTVKDDHSNEDRVGGFGSTDKK